VRDREIITVGLIGDATALPLLRKILGGDPKDQVVYRAINAITRLTQKDVRDRPVEEMNVEKTRRRVLELLPPR
jgi:HEAT repeat protein